MNWYNEEVNELKQRRDELPYQPRTIFYGSSTIRLWDSLYEDFAAYQPVNLGFGGSTLEACVHFFNDIVAPLQSANRMFIYAGDNDLGDGKAPDEVLHYFKQLLTAIDHHFPNMTCYYISIKPSISRWHINDNIKLVNALIAKEIEAHNHNFHYIDIYDSMLDDAGYPNAAYFEEDGLHLSEKGYEVLHHIIKTQGFTGI